MAAIKALDEILNKGQFSNEVLNLYADKVEKREQNF